MMHVLVTALSLISVLFFTGSLMAFDIQTNVLVQGEINGELKSKQMSRPVMGANSELSTYSFVINGREGITFLDHVFIHDPTVSKLNVLNSSNAGYALRVSETAGSAAAYPDVNKSGAVGSSYLVNQMDLSTDLDLEQGLYHVEATGEGSFTVVLIEDVNTIDPEVFEKYSYQLEGSGEFDLTGQYGFIGGSDIKVFPLEDAMVK
jgi:hypothetical protein